MPGPETLSTALATKPLSPRRRLMKIEANEWFAKQYDQFESIHGSQLSDWEIPVMKEQYANTYRRIVGCHPNERQQLRVDLLMKVEMANGEAASKPS